MISSIIASGLATFVTFPLEYWRTIQMSMDGIANKTGFALGNKLYSAFLVGIQRNIGFYLLFFTINENSRSSLKKLKFFEEL